MDKIRQTAGFLQTRLPRVPDTVIILGSGLGGFVEALSDKTEIAYGEIPNFLISTAPGHAGRLVYGKCGGKDVLCMQGRFHYYEGFSMQEIAFAVRVFRLMGVGRLIVTAATGAINPSYRVGDFVLISDHIKFFSDTPLRGANYGEFGPRFQDMSSAYTPVLRERAKQIANSIGQQLQEGVYAFMSGPSYETPAEIRALGIMGADVVGMSVVPEVITAAHCGMQVLGIACASNMAAGISKTPLSEEDVLEVANRSGEKFKQLVEALVQQL